MQPRVTLALRVLLALMLALLLTAQVLAVPAVAAETARRYPELAYLEIRGVIAATLLILCVQVTFVCVWALLSLVRRDAIFSRAAFRYVDVILGCIVAATVIVAVGFCLLVAAAAAPPAPTLLAVFGVVVGCGLSLLVVVLRGLLEKALRLEEDLAEVV